MLSRNKCQFQFVVEVEVIERWKLCGGEWRAREERRVATVDRLEVV